VSSWTRIHAFLQRLFFGEGNSCSSRTLVETKIGAFDFRAMMIASLAGHPFDDLFVQVEEEEA